MHEQQRSQRLMHLQFKVQLEQRVWRQSAEDNTLNVVAPLQMSRRSLLSRLIISLLLHLSFLNFYPFNHFITLITSGTHISATSITDYF